MTESFDIFVIGGGINGCGIARDAAGRGFTVGLAEMGDLAGGTSSGSTKLIHGGLRYLEFFEFRLVREALIERERLWASAPHIIRPLRFVLPHHAGLRPAWMLRLGLFLYDHIGGRGALPPTTAVNLRTGPLGAPLKDTYARGFEYSDCWVDDARLVVLNARDAADRGADIRVRTKVSALKEEGAEWRVTLVDAATGKARDVRARVLVNAAGPWADDVLRLLPGHGGAHNVRLVKGSHIIVPRLYAHDRSYVFQNADGRIVFAIPFEDDYTLLGTTDVDFTGDPHQAQISQDETRYICDTASDYFETPVDPASVVWSYSAVRPLYDDGAGRAQEATRDYVLKEDRATDAPLFNVFGGKITTYRRLAEAMLSLIESEIGARGPVWTAGAPLPGGDMAKDGPARLQEELRRARPWLPQRLAVRLAHGYGTDAAQILGEAGSVEELGPDHGAGLHDCELRWLVTREWARTGEDVLWRRTKLGLRAPAGAAGRIDTRIAEILAETGADGQ